MVQAGRLAKAIGLAGALVIGTMAAAEAATVFSEDFSGSTEGSYGVGNIPGTQFKVVTGNIDVIGPANYTCVAGAAIKCIDLIGSVGQGTIQSTVGIDLIAGNTYTIAYTDILQGFTIGGPETLAYTVSLGTQVFNAVSKPTVTPMSFSFTQGATELGALLTFATVGNIDGTHGPVISGLSVDAVSPVPVPAALPLFVSALAGLGFLNWRRRRTAA